MDVRELVRELDDEPERRALVVVRMPAEAIRPGYPEVYDSFELMFNEDTGELEIVVS